VLAPLRRALAGAPGSRLLDVGGGTGNYALALEGEGWDAVVVDRAPEMLSQAADKSLATVVGDAERLPFGADSFDATMLVSMLHHVDRPAIALAEARRVLRTDGRLAVMMFTREDIAEIWCLDYFPSSRVWMEDSHPPLAEIVAELPGARRLPVRYEDIRDGSLAALQGYPQLLLEERWRQQTSYFERMQRDHPDELQSGLERLAADLSLGRSPARPGRASVIAWSKPR
jgi:SAM-dependent methyltransferase